MATVRDILKVIDAQFPLSRAESWDRVGLQIGDANAAISKVLVAHEVTQSTLEAARGCDALVVYHPLLFRPLENLDFKNHTAKLAAQCIVQGLNVMAVHTALDSAPQPNALGDRLAAQLGLQNIEVLAPSGREALFKVVIFVPDSHLHEVSEAGWKAGAGDIGKYSHASFRTRGQGTFRPEAGADPVFGTIGTREAVEEWRLEVIVPEARRDAVVRAMIAAHPYEEVAHDIYPLHNMVNPYGSARVGQLHQTTTLNDWAQRVQSTLDAPNVRIVRATDSIARVACVPGAGASFIDAAARAGVDCLVTGDIKHHDALKAKSLGVSVIDATHSATERAAVSMIAHAVQSTLKDVEVLSCEIDTNPFESS